jgi:hypothetical protein
VHGLARRVLVLDAVLFAALITAAFANAGALYAVALALIGVILWSEGHLRFRRLRRFFRRTSMGVWAFLGTRRLSRRQLRNGGIALGVLLFLVALNQMKVAAPGKGYGLSVPAGAMSLNFTGINSPGEWIATSLSYALIVGLVALLWLRLWQQVALAGQAWRPRAYVAGLAAFVVAPILFAVLMATVAPDDPKENVEFSKGLLRFTILVMSAALCLVIAAPFVGERLERRQPTPGLLAATPKAPGV